MHNLPRFLFLRLNERITMYLKCSVTSVTARHTLHNSNNFGLLLLFNPTHMWKNDSVSTGSRSIFNMKRNFATQSYENLLPLVQYEEIAEETLQAITENFEEILDSVDNLDSDVTYNNGVLTIILDGYGTYVINRQSPSRQIWLSSPISGPKRYDYDQGTWIYKQDGISLYELLTTEISSILKKEVMFTSSSLKK